MRTNKLFFICLLPMLLLLGSCDQLSEKPVEYMTITAGMPESDDPLRVDFNNKKVGSEKGALT